MSHGLNRGVRNGHAKLTEQDVLAIRRRRAAGERRKDLAAEYGVGPYAIRDIVAHRSWAWLD